MNETNLRSYQRHSVEHLTRNESGALFLDMGLGKTVSTLTAIDRLLFDTCEVSKVLIIAPLRVAQMVWTDEVEKWEHLRHLTISKVLGTERQRKEALLAKADIYIINRENVVWLVAHYGAAFPFDMVVIDELSSFKSAKSARFKALRSIRPKVRRVVGLTGTPAPNGLLDLWPQVYLLDMGARLGKTLTGFREMYFRKEAYKPYAEYKILREPDDIIGEGYYEKKIYEKIGDICISMKAADYLTLPERIDREVMIGLNALHQEQYYAFERDQVLALQDAGEITAVNAAALTTKLLQYANGAIYNAEGEFHVVHDEKLEALEEIIEAANGQPVLVFYSYRHDLERIQARFRSYKPVHLKGADEVKKWNEGKTEVLLAHPASAGHGLNMQDGGNNIVWFGLPWSLELYQQANARLHRQGQLKPVVVHRIIVRGTMDEDVLASLDLKANTQDALMRAVKARVEKYIKCAKKV